MAESNVIDDMGLDDPPGLVVPRQRSRFVQTDEGVEQRKAEAVAKKSESMSAMHFDSPGATDWVEMARNWMPLIDLTTRVVQPDFAVEGLILSGKVGALVAAGGTGKTTILAYLGVCIATGRPFFGCKVKPGTFVLLSNDDGQEDLEGALSLVMKAMQLTDDEAGIVALKVRIFSLQGQNGCKVFTTNLKGATVATGLDTSILQAVGHIPDLVGIALDTLRQFSGGSSNDEQVVKLTIAAATEVAVATGAFVILPHHTGKQNFRDGVSDMYAGSGSAAIADNCRFVLLLQTATWSDIESKVRRTGQERGDPLVLISTRGSLLVKAPEPMFLHRDGFYIGRVAGAVLTRDQQLDDRDREVLRAIRAGAQSKRQIEASVKGKSTTIYRHIDDLELRRHIENVSPNASCKYVVTDSGLRLLEQAP